MQNTITLYYDPYEFSNGDGFYPLAFPSGPCQKPIDIKFEFYDDELTQLTGPRICGYDGDTRSEIIKQLV